MMDLTLKELVIIIDHINKPKLVIHPRNVVEINLICTKYFCLSLWKLSILPPPSLPVHN